MGEDEVVGAGARLLDAVEVVGADEAEVRAAAVLHIARVVVGELPHLRKGGRTNFHWKFISTQTDLGGSFLKISFSLTSGYSVNKVRT